MRSKRCSECGETKTSEEFHRDRTKRDGLQALCKKCRRAYDRAYYEEHQEERLVYRRAYYEDHREEHLASCRAYNEEHREARRAYHRAYREEHREERTTQTRKRNAKTLNASREVATRNGEPWTAAEDHVALTSNGTELEIAIELGRTTSSVHSRRALLRRKAVAA